MQGGCPLVARGCKGRGQTGEYLFFFTFVGCFGRTKRVGKELLRLVWRVKQEEGKGCFVIGFCFLFKRKSSLSHLW